MRKLRRRTAAVVVVAGAATLLALLLGQVSASEPATVQKAGAVMAHATLRERENGEDEGGADAEAYADRAYPNSEIAIDQIRGAITANKNVVARKSRLVTQWSFIGPDLLDV